EDSGTVAKPCLQLLAEEARGALACIVGRQIGLARFRDPVVATVPARAVRGGEQERMLRMVARLRVAGWDRLLRQPLDEGRSGRVSREKARYRLGNGLASDRVGQLSPEEGEKVFGRPYGKAFDGIGQDVGRLAAGDLEFHRE